MRLPFLPALAVAVVLAIFLDRRPGAGDLLPVSLGAAAGLAACFRPLRSLALPLAGCLAALLVLRAGRVPPESRLEAWHGLVLWTEGRVVEVTPRGRRLRLVLDCRTASILRLGPRPLAGKAIAYLDLTNAGRLAPGQLVRVHAELAALPADPKFAFYWDYLRRTGVRSRLADVERVEAVAAAGGLRRSVAVLRDAGASLYAPLPPRPRAFLRGLAYGDKRDIAPEVVASFTAAGVVHVLAVSGMNIAMLAAAWFFLFRRIPWARRPATLVFIALLPVYAAMCAFTPSVTRAALMSALALGALLANDEVCPYRVLAAAALGLLSADPDLLFDPGFLLSFAATLGIVALWADIAYLLGRARLPRWLAISLAVSCAAQLAVLPITAAFFGRVSLLSPVANVPVVPLVFVLLVGGTAAAIVLHAGGGAWIGDLVDGATELLYGIVERFAALPWAVAEMPGWSAVAIAGYYAAVLGATKGLAALARAREKRRLAAEVRDLFGPLPTAGG